MIRFKVSHLIVVLTLAAFAAIVAKQVLEHSMPFRGEWILTFLVTGIAGIVTGVVLGFLLRGDKEARAERRRLIPLVVALGLVNVGALAMQDSALRLLRHADNDLAGVISFFIYLDDLWVFTIVTIVIVTSLLWGIVARREKMIRLIAAISLAFWFLIFACGYLGAASSAIDIS